MPFPTTGILDNFNRSDEGPPLSSDWTEGGWVSDGWKVVSNEAQPESVNLPCAEYYNVADYGPACEAYCTIAAAMQYGSVLARLQDEDTANQDDYHVQWRTSEGKVRLYRADDGVNTQLGVEISQTIADDDDIGIECNGSTITAYYNDGGAGWGSIGSRTDSTYSNAGKIGISAWTSAPAFFQVDDFGGGTIAGEERQPRPPAAYFDGPTIF